MTTRQQRDGHPSFRHFALLGAVLLGAVACSPSAPAQPTAVPAKPVATQAAASAPTQAAPKPAPAEQAAAQPTQAAASAKAAAGSGKAQEVAKLYEAAKTEGGTIVWQTGLTPEEAKPIIAAFQEKYPGLKIEASRITGTDSRERLLREMMAGQSNVDVFDVGGEELPTFREAGVLTKVDWTEYADVRPEQADDGYTLSIGGSVHGIGINTNLVKGADVPKTWDDLLDPKWQGKIVVDSRPKTFTGLMPVWGEEKVIEFVKKLSAQKPQFRRGQTDSINLMSAGEFPLIGGTYNHSLLLVKDKGAPVDIVYPEPVPISLENQAVAKGSKRPNASKLLLTWLASDGNQFYDQATHRGLPLPGFNTQPSRALQGKQLSEFIGQWTEREAELSERVIAAMGVKQ